MRIKVWGARGSIHPNRGFGFRLEENMKSVAFFPDNELSHPHPGGKTFEEAREAARAEGAEFEVLASSTGLTLDL